MKSPIVNQSTAVQPIVVILAGQLLESGLEALFGKREVACLMIAGATVIEHILRELQGLNFSQCIILAGQNANEINALVMELPHLDMKVEVMNYALSKDHVLRDFSSMGQPSGLLLIEVNQLRSHSIQKFLDRSNATDYLLCSATGPKKSLGLTHLKPSNADFITNAKSVEVNEVVVNPLLTPRDFHQANIDVVLGKYSGVESSVAPHAGGRQLQHWSVEVDERVSVDRAGVMIDRSCRVERNVSLSSVVLNP